MSDQQCAYFRDESVSLKFPGASQATFVPVYRCALADAMIVRLHDDDEGRALAAAIALMPQEEDKRSMFGPDLVAPNPATCTVTRRLGACQPAFTHILSGYGIDARVPDPDSRTDERSS